ncbi:probable ascorbate-specific transmembrane electron transporter 1 isoform X2 [Phragmites australis]|uniref:probable ascorbate-specific transmembrane electron transporter 1 isoform X2 n=1 Tax=Phragmites australis TaxID=29695 RepID=UPI002D780A56|nr:probable ascorbate-specific transmembrane electron transporter 1 isoform X2 [Phragmites australis]
MDMKGASASKAAVDARTLVVHVLAVAATVLVLLWCVHFRGGLALRSHDKPLIFNVHPVLMVVGLIVLAGEAILSYRSLPVSRDARKKAHLALHAAGLAAGLLGVYAVFKFHVESGIPNLYSLHSWLGIATISLYALQWLAGFLAFFFPGASPATRRAMLPWHAVLGLLVFVLAVGTAQLGFLEKLTFLQGPPLRLPKYGAEALLVNFTAVVVLLLGIAVVLAAVTIDGTRQ